MKLIASRPVGATSALALYKMAPSPACASANGAAGNNKSQRAPRMPNQAVVKIGQDYCQVGIALSVQRQILRKRMSTGCGFF
jgi:hypothetical protein